MSPAPTRAQIAEKLRAHPILAGLDDALCAEILKQGQITPYKPKQMLTREGDPAEAYWFLCSGSVKVFYTSPEGFEVVVKIFVAPAAWAEMEVLTNQPHIENCCAVDHAVALRLPKAAFSRLLEQYPRFMKNVLLDTCARFFIAAQNERVLAFLSVQQRIAHLLLSYVRAYGVPVPGGVGIRLKLSQSELANGVGATRKSVTRALVKWQREKILSRRGTQYVIHDLHRLAQESPQDLVGVDWIAGESVDRGRGARLR